MARPERGTGAAGRVSAKWIAERPLASRTVDKYKRLLRLHIEPELAAERPIASVEQGYAIAEASKPWYRTLVFTAAMTGLRWGELVALRRRHLDSTAALWTCDRPWSRTGRT
jgi:integrase